jgi:hypothetical protein
MQRRRRSAGRKAAAEGVAAYLADDDAEVHNLTETAVRENALLAALNLTGLAAEAITELAAERRLQPAEVLRSLTEDPQRHLEMQAVYPAWMDDYEWAMTEAKGWIELTVRSPQGEKTITFYDPVRLAREVQDAMTGPGYFTESAIVVIPAVTRKAIEAAMTQIAGRAITNID